MTMRTAIYLSCLLSGAALADTVADCRYEQIKGTWTFHFTDAGADNNLVCDGSSAYTNSIEMDLDDINKVYRHDMGTEGWFTLIYNQGFEIIINERKWFAFFTNDRESSSYDCSTTEYSWVHDVMSNDWACFYAVKNDESSGMEPVDSILIESSERRIFTDGESNVVEQLGMFRETEKRPHPSVQHQRRPRTGAIPLPKTVEQVVEEVRSAQETVAAYDKMSGSIPEEFDWNDFDMVSPVKDQGNCGSCYAFASVGMFEARARVQSNGAWKPLFSEQDVAACSQYSQECHGGFPYLISKYGQDWGIAEESCAPVYNATDGSLEPCTTDPSCVRHKISDYGYVGDYYGGATEYAMRQEIYQYGPIAVSLDAGGLQDYDGGIWIQPSSGKFYDPFEVTTHVVVITGWGWDDTDQGPTPFWNVKNSWGTDFGEDGYFRIIRGVDNAAIESLPAKCTMVPPIDV